MFSKCHDVVQYITFQTAALPRISSQRNVWWAILAILSDAHLHCDELMPITTWFARWRQLIWHVLLAANAVRISLLTPGLELAFLATPQNLSKDVRRLIMFLFTNHFSDPGWPIGVCVCVCVCVRRSYAVCPDYRRVTGCVRWPLEVRKLPRDVSDNTFIDQQPRLSALRDVVYRTPVVLSSIPALRPVLSGRGSVPRRGPRLPPGANQCTAQECWDICWPAVTWGRSLWRWFTGMVIPDRIIGVSPGACGWSVWDSNSGHRLPSRRRRWQLFSLCPRPLSYATKG